MARSNTKQRILDVAARQFADHGFSGTSLRRIMREADVNVAATHYHFGSKEALHKAVIEPTLMRVQARRLELLEACSDLPADTPDLVERIMYAACAPHVELARDEAGINYVRIVARYSTESREVTLRLFKDLIEPVRQRFIAALRRALPELSDEELFRGYGFVTATMMTSLVEAGYESLSGKSPIPDDLEALTETLVAFCASGLRGIAARGKGAGRSD